MIFSRKNLRRSGPDLKILAMAKPLSASDRIWSTNLQSSCGTPLQKARKNCRKSALWPWEVTDANHYSRVPMSISCFCRHHRPMNRRRSINISLLDCRYICGDKDRFEQLRELIPKMVARDAAELMQSLADLTRARHKKYGQTIFHLEPNIKDCPGGLRDYQVANWLTLVSELCIIGKDEISTGSRTNSNRRLLRLESVPQEDPEPRRVSGCGVIFGTLGRFIGLPFSSRRCLRRARACTDFSKTASHASRMLIFRWWMAGFSYGSSPQRKTHPFSSVFLNLWLDMD